MNKKYYLVTAKCGHVGKNFYIIKRFPIIAENAAEAAESIRWMPRVKHHDKHAIISVLEINEQVYEYMKQKNSEDPYFRAESIQDTNSIKEELYENRIREESSINETNHNKNKSKKSIKKRFLRKEFLEEIYDLEYSFA